MMTEVVTHFEARGAIKKIFSFKGEEALVHGPAGTGKSRGILEKVHLALLKYPGARGLFVRKTRSSLTNTGIVTFKDDVLKPGDNVNFHTPSQAYIYPNKSVLVVGGLDDPTKIMSGQYDIAFFQEATEGTIEDWESILTRLRNGVMPYQQLLGDANPAGPSHWLWRRCLEGKTVEFRSKHEDNPRYYNAVKKQWTKAGKAYLSILNGLSGIRYKRLRLGIWCSAEGAVYEDFDVATHVVDRFDIPSTWPRYWVIDFGYTNPFVWQAWAEDPDGRMYRYREIYRTQRTVSRHCLTIKGQNEPRPRAIICDHDAEDRATFEQEMKLVTIPASKEVSTGIQLVTDRLKVAGDGKPRIFFLKNSLIEVDPNLKSKMLPTCTEEEFDSYVWDDSTKTLKEVPLKKYDHGMDGTRYMAMHMHGKSHKRARIVALN